MAVGVMVIAALVDRIRDLRTGAASFPFPLLLERPNASSAEGGRRVLCGSTIGGVSGSLS